MFILACTPEERIKENQLSIVKKLLSDDIGQGIPSNFTNFFNMNPYFIYRYDMDKGLLGCICGLLFTTNIGKACCVTLFYVKKEYRNTGVGSSLIDKLKEILINRKDVVFSYHVTNKRVYVSHRINSWYRVLNKRILKLGFKNSYKDIELHNKNITLSLHSDYEEIHYNRCKLYWKPTIDEYTKYIKSVPTYRVTDTTGKNIYALFSIYTMIITIKGVKVKVKFIPWYHGDLSFVIKGVYTLYGDEDLISGYVLNENEKHIVINNDCHIDEDNICFLSSYNIDIAMNSVSLPLF